MKKIKDLTLEEYIELTTCGLFWELYPNATGKFDEDKWISEIGEFKIERDGND